MSHLIWPEDIAYLEVSLGLGDRIECLEPFQYLGELLGEGIDLLVIEMDVRQISHVAYIVRIDGWLAHV